MDNNSELVDRENSQGLSEEKGRDSLIKFKSPFPFLLTLSEDKMEIKVNGDIRGWEEKELLEELEKKLKELGVKKKELLEESKDRLKEIIKYEEIFRDIILLRGKPPKPSVEGRIEWSQDFFAEGFEIDPETGAMDYRRPKAQRNLKEGQLIATIILPVEGEDGYNALGEVIPVQKPKPIRLRAGRNVRTNSSNTQFYSTVDGRFRLEGDTIHVDNVLEIHGSVGLETGHIKHLGMLIIHKNIEADSIVHSEGDIEVKGYIEQAEVSTNGKLLIYGGISGNFEKTIYAKETITAKYLLNAVVESEGGVYIAKEIAQSKVYSRGPVVVNGRIVGGEIVALGEIKADQLGSEACIRTSLIVGEDFFLPRYLKPLEDEKKEKEELLEKILKGLLPVQNRWQSLPQDARNAFVKLVQQAKTLKEVISEIDSKISAYLEESRKRAKFEVVVRKDIYPEVNIKMGGCVYHNKEFFKGPLKLAILNGEIQMFAV
ncbi:MAG: FapA family protein [Candidatus Hydrogenedentes bacterium]|nr:FapA family protein [Candidatus Hydrogenedentota bacterium]